MKNLRSKNASKLLLVLLLVLALLFSTACAGDADSSEPSEESVAVSDGEAASASDNGESESSADTMSSDEEVSVGSSEANDATTTASGADDSTDVTTGKSSSGSNGGGILVNKTTTTTKKTSITTVTAPPADLTVKEQILDLFDSSMSGKTISFLCGWKQGDDEKRKLETLQKETGVKVRWLVAEGTDYGTRLSSYINAGQSPDLALLDSLTYPNLVIKGCYQDLSVAGIDLNNKLFDTDLMEDMKWNDKNYALIVKNSENNHFNIVFYNKSIFKRLNVTDPGVLWEQGNWNWDTFLSCAQATNDPNSGVLGCELYRPQDFLMTSGIGIVSVGNGTITNNLGDSRILEAWTFINKLYYEYKVTESTAGAENNFASGKSAMMLGQTWQANVGGIITVEMEDEWGVVPFPCKKGVNVAIINPRGAAIPIGAKNPKAALATFTYYVSSDTGTFGEGFDNIENAGNYDRNAFNAVRRAMWEMEKVSDTSEGLITYGGNYNIWEFGAEVTSSGMSGINTSINKWKSAIDICIRQIMTEFS